MSDVWSVADTFSCSFTLRSVIDIRDELNLLCFTADTNASASLVCPSTPKLKAEVFVLNCSDLPRLASELFCLGWSDRKTCLQSNGKGCVIVHQCWKTVIWSLIRGAHEYEWEMNVMKPIKPLEVIHKHRLSCCLCNRWCLTFMKNGETSDSVNKWWLRLDEWKHGLRVTFASALNSFLLT